MRLLLDTHTFIWYVNDNPKLSREAKRIIDEVDDVLLSQVSVWEIAIKQSIGKLSFEIPFRQFIERQTQQNNIDLLNITLEHIEITATLPLHHRDPFDRLIIAQAISEGLSLVSRDEVFDAYPIHRLW